MKKIIGMIIALSLVLSSSIMGFAASEPIRGTSVENPIRFGEKFEFKDLSVYKGKLKSGYVKVLDAKIDNVGGKQALIARDYNVTAKTLAEFDFYKVKLEVQFTGYTGPKDTYLKRIIPTACGIGKDYLDGSSYEDTDITYSYKGALENDFYQYEDSANKMIKGKHYVTRVSKVNLTKPYTYTGDIYLIIDKDSLDGIRLRLNLEQGNTKYGVDNSIFFQLDKNEIITSADAPKKFGDENVGFLKSTAKFAEKNVPVEVEDIYSYTRYYEAYANNETVLAVILGQAEFLEGKTLEDLLPSLYEADDTVASEEKINGNMYYGLRGLSKDGFYYYIVYLEIDGKLRYFGLDSTAEFKDEADKIWESYKLLNHVE